MLQLLIVVVLVVWVPGVVVVEWHNQPIRFDAPTQAHRDRFHAGMTWLAARIEKFHEDIDDEDRRTALAATADGAESLCTCPEGHEAHTREGALLSDYCPAHGIATADGEES